MDIYMYNNLSDDRKINKQLTEGVLFQGQLKEECDMMHPIIKFDSADVLRYNYCYVPDFQRYYSVNSSTAYGVNMYDLTLECDVLMSFRNEIMQLSAIVNRQSMSENGDEYINDDSLVTENLYFKDVYNFLGGFNDTPSYILITAG